MGAEIIELNRGDDSHDRNEDREAAWSQAGRERVKLLKLVHRSKLFDAYRSELVFALSDITPESDFEELIVNYKAVVAGNRLRNIHHDLLRADLSFGSGEEFYCGLTDAVAADFAAQGISNLIEDTAWTREGCSGWHPSYGVVFYGTVLALLGERYIDAETSELTLATIGRALAAQNPQFLDSPDGQAPLAAEDYFPRLC